MDDLNETIMNVSPCKYRTIALFIIMDGMGGAERV